MVFTQGEGVKQETHERRQSRKFEFLRLTTIQSCAKGSPVWLAFRPIWFW